MAMKLKANMSRGAYGLFETDKPDDVTLGFEWEIPQVFYKDYFDYDKIRQKKKRTRTEQCLLRMSCPLDGHSQNFMERYPLRFHSECGGVEITTPVFQSLRQAKELAKRLILRANKDKALSTKSQSESSFCGIHVHFSHDGNLRDTFVAAGGMLNRVSSKDFVWQFSGREQGKPYSEQAVTRDWDISGRNSLTYYYARDYFSGMIRFHGQDNIELRLWDSHEDNLLNALEFSHALGRFIPEYLGQNRGDIPYLTDFKAWLKDKREYNHMKSHPAWDAVEEN